MSQQDSLWHDKTMKKVGKRVDAFLADIAGGLVTIESAFDYREDGGIRILLPKEPTEMSEEQAANMLLAQAAAKKEQYEFTKQIQCRPMDGAYAFTNVVKELYGMPAIGQAIHSFFGTQPPEIKTVRISPTETIQVPFGMLSFPQWGAQFNLGAYNDPDYGISFQIYVLGKKMYEKQIQGLLLLVEKRVKEDSIYRGKALRGVTMPEPEFYNPYEVDRSTVVYAQPVYEALVDQIWGVIECAELFRESNAGYRIRQVWKIDETGNPMVRNGDPITEWVKVPVDDEAVPILDEEGKHVERTERTHIRLGNNVLLHGENGTGKTLAAAVTGQYCLENEWTFVEARWDEDLRQVLRFVERVGSPAVVVIEDVENLFPNKDAMKRLLGEFDGMRTKGFDLMLLMTSNHVGELPKSMLGGHRIDHTIYVSDLDTEGVERLVKVLVPASQREELDFEQLHAAYEGFTPSWIVRNLEDVGKHSIIRTRKIGQPHSTEDFVRAAHALRPAWTLHQDATDRPVRPELETALRELVSEEVERHYVDISDTGEILLNG
jgi:transitional endoplasmic reticulum ATPase